MSASMEGIGSIARQGIASIPSPTIRHALDTAYQSASGRGTVDTAHRVFDRLTSSTWPVESLCRFLSGWRATHGTAIFVSGLIVRIQRDARKTSGSPRTLLHEVAAEVGEIIPEDTGVTDTPHEELFAAFANYIVGDDRWKLDRYAIPGCEHFRAYVKNQRLYEPIEDGILTTAASENWNSGEYTYLDRRIKRWMIDVLNRPAKDAEEKAKYVSTHAGETERNHFRHALDAW